MYWPPMGRDGFDEKAKPGKDGMTTVKASSSLPARTARPMTLRAWIETAWRALPRLRRECRVVMGVVGLY